LSGTNEEKDHRGGYWRTTDGDAVTFGGRHLERGLGKGGYRSTGTPMAQRTSGRTGMVAAKETRSWKWGTQRRSLEHTAGGSMRYVIYSQEGKEQNLVGKKIPTSPSREGKNFPGGEEI